MAQVSQTVTPTPKLLPFTGRGSLREADRSDLPRAKITWAFDDIVITAKIATNTNTFGVSMTLPANYAYALLNAEFTMQFDTDVDAADNFSTGTLTYFTANTGGPAFVGSEIRLGLVRHSTLTNDQAGSILVLTPNPTFKDVFFNQLGLSPLVLMHVLDTDGTNATAVGALKGEVSFLQFDLNQAFDVTVNAPSPVRNI